MYFSNIALFGISPYITNSYATLYPSISHQITSYHITSHHVTSRRVASRRVASRRVASRHVTSRHVTSRHVTSRHVTSRHVTSRHVTSRHVTSRHVTSRHVTSHHITSHHITSHHITSPAATYHRNTISHHQNTTTRRNGKRWCTKKTRFGQSTSCTFYRLFRWLKGFFARNFRPGLPGNYWYSIKDFIHLSLYTIS